MSAVRNNRVKGSRKSSGRMEASTSIKIIGRVQTAQTPASAIGVVNLSPINATNNLGAYSVRLAAEADLWQEYRFTRLSIHHLPTANGLSDQPHVVGFSNVVVNAAPTSEQEILEMPVSRWWCMASANTSPDVIPKPRQTLKITSKELRPAFTPWLKTVASSGSSDFILQGALYYAFNRRSPNNLICVMFVDYEIEFRNPVPAVETLVLRRGIPGYHQSLLKALADEEKDADVESQWSDAAHEKAAPCLSNDSQKLPSLKSGKR